MDGLGDLTIETSTEKTKYNGHFRGHKKEGEGTQESKGVKNDLELVGIEEKSAKLISLITDDDIKTLKQKESLEDKEAAVLKCVAILCGKEIEDGQESLILDEKEDLIKKMNEIEYSWLNFDTFDKVMEVLNKDEVKPNSFSKESVLCKTLL